MKIKHKKNNETRAVKIIPTLKLTEDEKQDLIKEAEILKSLDHPNLLKIFEYSIDNQNFYIVTEFVEGGELFNQIMDEKQFSEQQAAYYMEQIL